MNDLQKRIEDIHADIPDEAWDSVPDNNGWMSINSAPRDFTGILACAKGADGRPLRAIVRWGCAAHCFSSWSEPCRTSAEGGPDCEMQWLGEIGTRYGVQFTHWQHLPKPPY